MNRSAFLRKAGSYGALGLVPARLDGLSGGATDTLVGPAVPAYDAIDQLVPIRADPDDIIRVTVCLRPFRAAGPRLDVEQLDEKVVFHNYGHGGSGWSLSWGSAAIVIDKLVRESRGERDVAILGCGALGITAAISAQRADMRATIYAKEQFPYVRSARTTGSWTPDSRIALTAAASSEFAALWEQMARASFTMYQSYLGPQELQSNGPTDIRFRILRAMQSSQGECAAISTGSQASKIGLRTSRRVGTTSRFAAGRSPIPCASLAVARA